MRFSLATFLLLLITTALVVIYFVGVSSIARTRENIAELSADIAKTQPLYQRAKHKIEVSRQVMASPVDSTWLDDAEEKFAEIQQRYSELTVADPKEVWIVTVPIANVGNEKTAQWNVYVPEDVSVELVATVLNARGKPVPQPTPFAPSQFAHELVPGKSAIEIRQFAWEEMNGKFGTFRYEFKLNNVSVWTTRHTTDRKIASQSNKSFPTEVIVLKDRPAKLIATVVDFVNGRSKASLRIMLRRKP